VAGGQQFGDARLGAAPDQGEEDVPDTVVEVQQHLGETHAQFRQGSRLPQ
jgi:hypothetical protein